MAYQSRRPSGGDRKGELSGPSRFTPRRSGRRTGSLPGGKTGRVNLQTSGVAVSLR